MFKKKVEPKVVTLKENGEHLCFKQAQPEMCHSPKVDDEVDIFFKFSTNSNTEN